MCIHTFVAIHELANVYVYIYWSQNTNSPMYISTYICRKIRTHQCVCIRLHTYLCRKSRTRLYTCKHTFVAKHELANVYICKYICCKTRTFVASHELANVYAYMYLLQDTNLLMYICTDFARMSRTCQRIYISIFVAKHGFTEISIHIYWSQVTNSPMYTHAYFCRKTRTHKCIGVRTFVTSHELAIVCIYTYICRPHELAKACMYVCRMTVSTEITTPPTSTRSRYSDFSVSRATNSNAVQIQIEILVSLNLCRGIWVSGFGGFWACSIFSGISHESRT